MKKKMIALMLAGVMSVSLLACGGSDTSESSVQETTIEEASDTADETSTEEPKAGAEETTEIVESEENVTIELIAGEQGEYGSLITMNEGTDIEEIFYVYYVPGGTYTVTNKSEYMTQVSVYEGFARNEESGYDEYTATGEILLLDAEKTDTIEIPDGWFIEIQEPTHISLTLIDSK